ncbi:UNVERIFIED_CONTAM: hypothetical protein RMT77_008541 [Armadillidium vulgare]
MNAVANIKLKDVKELYTQNLSCIKKITSSYTILLHPLYLNDIKNGVKIELNSMLKNYCKQLKGIVLGFEGVKINFPSGWIFDTNPFLHINIVADFYVFSPEIGSILKGKVVKKSPNHVGCLVHNIFNASSSIPNGITKESWCGNSIREGDSLEMKITELNLTCAVPFLKGDIIPESICLVSKDLPNIRIKEEKAEDEDSGISGVEKPNDEDIESESENKKKKKKKKKNSAVENLVEESIESPKKSKKRKRNNLENSNDDLEEGVEKLSKKIKLENSSENLSDENMGEDTKKKKKKKKKIKEES